MSRTKVINIPFGRPWITDEDRNAVIRVLDGPILTHGPICHEFENTFGKYIQGGHAVTVSSCTAGMHLYYMYIGVGPNDEVILPGISHVATAHALEITGAKPVFVDCDAYSGNIDPNFIENAITPATKAISVVHFLGIPADMDRIIDIADKYNLKVLEDCAVGLGTKWGGKNVGLFGDGAAFSFYPAKHITSAEGGMFLSKHRDTAAAINKIRGFSYDKTLEERSLPGIYDVDGLGLNYRMSELQAALGLNQLKRIDEILQIRQRNFNLLKEGIKDIKNIRILESSSTKAKQSYYLMGIVLEGKLKNKRNQIILKLKEGGIGTGVHYPHPLPRLKYYRNKYGYNREQFINSETIADCSFNLPLGPHIDEKALDYIITNTREILFNC